nr:CpsB/CapC family capsule biosynthesis tyrosine phosphatase [Coralloluteibacterium stylophorae]
MHCHMLPAIDDGAPSLAVAMEMARRAVADGIRVTACTPHVYPGLYENDAAGIRTAVAALQRALEQARIPLRLVVGGDVHLVPGLVEGLRRGVVPTLAGSRYFLLEPPHHLAPPRFHASIVALIEAGYVPVITHPERLDWIDDHYEVFVSLARHGAWMQLTAGAVLGRFGARVRGWSERFLDDGLVHLLATDAHDCARRPPELAAARDAVASRLGSAEAERMVAVRPTAVLADAPPESVPMPAQPAPTALPGLRGLIGRGLRRMST